MGNRIAQILELTTVDCWNHVVSEENPADCASRGMFLSELLKHDLWWHEPQWLKLHLSEWPRNNIPINARQEDEELHIATCTLAVIENPLIPIDRLSSFYLYKRITAWVFRFLHNCKAKIRKTQLKAGPLTLEELNLSVNYWYAVIQGAHFSNELRILSKDSLEIQRSTLLIPSLMIKESVEDNKGPSSPTTADIQ